MDAKARCAVVTGANKGIGLETCRQLAATGITVVLTARDEKRGLQALENLKASGANNVVFHRLDVADPSTFPPLVEFVKSKFGKLDILINNAAILGSKVNWHYLQSQVIANKSTWHEDKSYQLESGTYETAEECLKVNYFGPKKIIDEFIPLLRLSNSPRILNVASKAGLLQFLGNEWAKGVLNDVDNLTEGGVDEVVEGFLEDFKNGNLEARGWPKVLTSYVVSKAALNAYTRVLAKKFPGILVNCAYPGYVKTDITDNTGILSVEQGAENLVKVALLHDDGPSGAFFRNAEVSSFVFNEN